MRNQLYVTVINQAPLPTQFCSREFKSLTHNPKQRWDRFTGTNATTERKTLNDKAKPQSIYISGMRHHLCFHWIYSAANETKASGANGGFLWPSPFNTSLTLSKQSRALCNRKPKTDGGATCMFHRSSDKTRAHFNRREDICFQNRGSSRIHWAHSTQQSFPAATMPYLILSVQIWLMTKRIWPKSKCINITLLSRKIHKYFVFGGKRCTLRGSWSLASGGNQMNDF